LAQVLELHDAEEEKLKTYGVLMDPELRTEINEVSEWQGGELVGDIFTGTESPLSTLHIPNTLLIAYSRYTVHQSGELGNSSSNAIPFPPWSLMHQSSVHRLPII